jgi:predicted DNA binding protein
LIFNHYDAINTAEEQGFFESLGRISLTTLAMHLNMPKSNLEEILRRAGYRITVDYALSIGETYY